MAKKKVVEPKIEKVKEVGEPPKGTGKPPVIEEVKKVEVKEVEKVESPQEFSVYNDQGAFVRTYSVEQHGENAGEIAEGFAEKINGSIK